MNCLIHYDLTVSPAKGIRVIIVVYNNDDDNNSTIDLMIVQVCLTREISSTVLVQSSSTFISSSQLSQTVYYSCKLD